MPSITGWLTYDGAGPNPVTVEVATVTATINADGYLVGPDGDPLRIAPTDDPLMSAVGWTWTATAGGRSVRFSAPSHGTVELSPAFVTAPPWTRR